MKKNKIVIVSIISVIILSSLFLSFNMFDNDTPILENKKKNNNHNNSIAMMLETSYNSKNYQESTTNSWPSSGYVFNETLSRCENGSEISYDTSTKKVTIIGETNDKCYVYFDKGALLLSNYIKGLYTTQGAKNLYHHDETLENGINDGSYRYAGKYESVNNWVCFGSNEAKCPANNLYRIIGVFNEKVLNEDGTDSGKKEERVKLIMNDYPGESVLGKTQDGTQTPYSSFTGPSKPSGAQPGYVWSGSTSINSNNWLTSTFNTETLNGTYLTKLGSEWTSKIATTEWKVGGNAYNNIYNVKVATTYQNEIVSPIKTTTDAKKVGLMYASDYGLAASKENWTTNLISYNNDTNRNNNWIYRGVYEWTITPTSSDSVNVFFVHYYGLLSANSAYNGYGARPNFYLEASVTYASGEGTQTSPYRIG